MDANVTPRQRKAIEALLTHGTVSQAAKAAHVARKTIYAWLRQPAFRAALSEAEHLALDALQRTLVHLGDAAAHTLESAMLDADSDSVKVRAADVVLSRLLQLRELVSLDARVAALEAKANEK